MNAEQFSSALGKVNDKYIMEAITYKKEKRSGWLKWGAMVACFGLILTAALVTLPGILKGTGGVVPPPAPVVSDDDEQSNADSSQSSNEQNVIINWDNVMVNESAGMAPDAALRYYDPDLYVMETWGEEEIVAYYGWNLAPNYIPEGLSADGQSIAAGIWREKATGEIVEDQTGRSFWADGSHKSDDGIVIPTGFSIIASKQGILHCGLLPVDESKTTDFSGVPVTLSHCSLPYGPFDPTQKAPDGLSNMPAGYYDVYVASFTLEGVEYEVEAQSLELEEVIKVVASVINVPPSEDFTVGNNPQSFLDEEEKSVESQSISIIPDIENSYNASNNSAAGQDYSVGKPNYEDSESEVEGCYDDPSNPVAEQNYSVGQPHYE